MTDLVKSYVSIIMSERFSDITSRPDAPFQNAGLGIGKLCETCEVTMGNVMCRNNEAIPAFKAFMTEIEKMKRYGFTDDEVSRAKDNILSQYEKRVQGADTRKNAEFIQEYINNFFDNYAYMEPEVEYQYAQAICSQLTADVLNQIAASLITDDNMVVVYYGPEKEGISHPSEQDFLNAIAEVKKSDIEPNEAQDFNRPLLDAAALKGSPVKKTAEGIYGSTEWTLKNGLKVVVLPTEYKKDQVLFSLEKDGGLSLVADEDMPSFEDNIFGLFQRNSGVSEFSGTDLQKMLAGKNVSVRPYIGSLRHGISGSASPKDLETAFQLMYLYFMDPRFDETEYQTGIEQIKAVLPNLESQPSFKFQNEMIKTIFGNSPRRPIVNDEVIEKASLATIERVYRSLFRDVAGATLYITGNVDMETLKPMVEKYAGSLTKGKKATSWTDAGADVVKGEITNHFNVEMETPKTTVLQVYTAYFPYSVKNSVMLEAAKYILDMIYTDTLREEEGGTYGASVGSTMQNEPEAMAMIQVYFDTNPEAAARLIKSAVDGLKNLAADGPTEEQLNRAIENAKKNLPESRISNSYWRDALMYWNRYGMDYDKEFETAISEISAENIKAVLNEVLSQNNFIEIVMSPEK